jgi:hypothetical protein
MRYLFSLLFSFLLIAFGTSLIRMIGLLIAVLTIIGYLRRVNFL